MEESIQDNVYCYKWITSIGCPSEVVWAVHSLVPTQMSLSSSSELLCADGGTLEIGVNCPQQPLLTFMNVLLRNPSRCIALFFACQRLRLLAGVPVDFQVCGPLNPGVDYSQGYYAFSQWINSSGLLLLMLWICWQIIKTERAQSGTQWHWVALLLDSAFRNNVIRVMSLRSMPGSSSNDVAGRKTLVTPRSTSSQQRSGPLKADHKTSGTSRNGTPAGKPVSAEGPKASAETKSTPRRGSISRGSPLPVKTVASQSSAAAPRRGSIPSAKSPMGLISETEKRALARRGSLSKDRSSNGQTDAAARSPRSIAKPSLKPTSRPSTPRCPSPRPQNPPVSALRSLTPARRGSSPAALHRSPVNKTTKSVDQVDGIKVPSPARATVSSSAKAKPLRPSAKTTSESNAEVLKLKNEGGYECSCLSVRMAWGSLLFCVWLLPRSVSSLCSWIC